VNYFGHAAVASWYSADPAVALGAMLPDFSTMSGARLAPPDDAAIAEGIALHHRTDGVFHQAAPVLALMRELDAYLAASGCARGPRRAAAHIGVELLLDGVLVARPEYREAYTGALAVDASSLRGREPTDAPRLAALLERLRSYGVPDDLQRPDAIVHRLQRMLAHRPLLAPSAADLTAMRTALVGHKPRVEVAVETVLRAVRAGLS
jgi:hypothetical protein